MGGELGLGCRRCPESFVVKRVEILPYSPRRISRINLAGCPVLGVARVLLLNIGADQAGIDHEALTAHQAFLHAARNNRLEYMTQQIAVTEPTMAVFAESRVVWDAVGKIKTTEPAIRQAQMHFFKKAAFGRMPKQYPMMNIRIISSGSTAEVRDKLPFGDPTRRPANASQLLRQRYLGQASIDWYPARFGLPDVIVSSSTFTRKAQHGIANRNQAFRCRIENFLIKIVSWHLTARRAPYRLRHPFTDHRNVTGFENRPRRVFKGALVRRHLFGIVSRARAIWA